MRSQEALRCFSFYRVGMVSLCCYFLSSCGGSGPPDIQDNDVYTYKLFDLLDKKDSDGNRIYGALHDAIRKQDPAEYNPNMKFPDNRCEDTQIRLDQCVVNDLLAETMDEHYRESINYFAGQYAAIDSTTVGIPSQYPLQNILQLARHLLTRIIHQDDFDNGAFDPSTKLRTISASNYATDFFSFLDDINEKNLEVGNELVAIGRAITKFRNDRLTPELMRKEVEYANFDLGATSCQASTYDKARCDHVLARHKALTHQQSSIGKSNLQADYPLWLDNQGFLIKSWENISKGDNRTNIGIGNAVKGNQALLMAIFELTKNADFRNNLYELIRQLGVFVSSSAPQEPGSSERYTIADIGETLIRNIENYFTTGGSNATEKYNTDDSEMYSSAELRNTLKELQPSTIRLLLRSDRTYGPDSDPLSLSLLSEITGKKIYFLDEFIKSFKSIDWNPTTARIEESIEDLLRCDVFGSDRTDPNSGARHRSFLEGLFFIDSITTNYGWTDAASDGVESDSSSTAHGHGKARLGSPLVPSRSAGSTLNDGMFAMGTADMLYSLLFETFDADGNRTDVNKDHLFRSLWPFTIDGNDSYNIPSKDENKFYFDQNYPVALMVTGAAGAPGSPSGGRAPRDSNGNFILNGYMPYNPRGLENDNLALTTMEGLYHVCWNGYGPYYYDPERAHKRFQTTQLYGKTWKKVYRGNGKLYAYIHKPSGDRSANVEYLYPSNDSGEGMFPLAFYQGKIFNPTHTIFTSSVSLSSGVRIAAGTSLTFSIKLGDSSVRHVTLTGGSAGLTVKAPILCAEINNIIPDACYEFGKDLVKIKSDNPGTIVFGNVSGGGDAINALLVDKTIEIVTDSYEVFPNAAKLSSPATVNITIDNHIFDGAHGNAIIFPADRVWDRDQIVAFLKERINIPFTVVNSGYGKFTIIGNNRFSATKVVRIESVSGPNAVEILFGGNGTSIIREPFRDEFWNSVNMSDYYMGYYQRCTSDDPDSCTDMFSTLIRDNNDNLKLVRLDRLTNNEPSQVLTEEILSDVDPTRACASPEEAFFRNYQWFMNERKHLIIIPLHVSTSPPLNSMGILYQYVESNGFYGMANYRALRGKNGLWAKTGKSGRSTIPGDFRVGMVVDSFIPLVKNSYDLLGGGPGFSSALAQNVAAIARLAFPSVASGTMTWTDGNNVQHSEAIRDNIVPSYGFTVGDAIWNRRNAFMPILMSFIKALRDNTDYKHSNTTGQVPSFDMMSILLKPIFYYQKGAGDLPHNTWKFRVKGDGSSANFLKSGADFYTTPSKSDLWYGSDAERDYFQPEDITTLMSLLIDRNPYPENAADREIMNGILPLLVGENPDTHQRPRVLTQVFKLLMSLGETAFDDPAGIDHSAASQEFDTHIQSWGARRKLFYGLEQTMTLSKNTRGRFTEINDATLTETLPDWLYTNGVDDNNDGMPDDMRPEEIFANNDHNILIGSSDYINDIKPGELGYQMGIAYLPHDWDINPDKLTLFRTYLEMTSELLKPQGAEYSVVENVINVLDAFFSRVSPSSDQIEALIHTLGIIATTYNRDTNTWNGATVPVTTDGRISFDDYPFDFNDNTRVDDLYRVAGHYQPMINTIALALDTGVDINFDEGNGKTTVFNSSHYLFDSSIYLNAMMKGGGLLEYVLTVVDTTDKFNEIVGELYAFLGEPLFKNFKSSLWNDIAKLMAGQVQVLTRNDNPSAARDQYQDFGFQYNGQ